MILALEPILAMEPVTHLMSVPTGVEPTRAIAPMDLVFVVLVSTLSCFEFHLTQDPI
jgi:hypothetical protein